jgi:hypothetical protein
MRLPTDSSALSSFLSRVEGKPGDMERVSAKGTNLMVRVTRGPDGEEPVVERPSAMPNILEEGFIQSDFSADARIVDNRDAMRQRGWTYFRVRGRVSGQNVSGVGRLPFVYNASLVQPPWVKLQIADAVTLADVEDGAFRLKADGASVARYVRGSFFKGLSRPWMGLHAMDTVRRDAAEQRVDFETQVVDDGGDVEVTLIHKQLKLVYTIGLEADLVRKIEFFKADQSIGELKFEYLQDVDGDLREFTEPRRIDKRVSRRDSGGVLWLFDLADGRYGG